MLQFLGRCHVADATLFWRGTSSLISPKKKPGQSRAGLRCGTYLASFLVSFLASAFALALAFLVSDFLLSAFFVSVAAGALGAVSDFGACANALNANTEATSVTTSFCSMGTSSGSG